MGLLNILQSVLDLGFSTLSLLLLVLFLTAYWYLTGPDKPPGPLGVPIFGYMPFVNPKRVHIQLAELGEKYGSVFSLQMGSRLMIVLNDWNSIKAALIQQADNFSGRCLDDPIKPTEEFSYNIVASDGPHWREHRRFALQTLRDLGFGKNSMEYFVTAETRNLVDELDKWADRGEAVEINGPISVSMCNNICSMAMGRHFDHNDETFKQLKSKLEDNVRLINVVDPAVFFPWTKSIPVLRDLAKPTKLIKVLVDFNKICEEEVLRHEKEHIDGQKDDYIHAYLTEQKERGKEDTFFTRLALIDNTRIFFGAGTETSTTTIRWASVFLMLYPNIQKKLQEEIDRVIGRNRSPSYEDRQRTPYLEAFICEVMRDGTVIPLNVLHSNLEATTILGQPVPKRSYILTNIWYVHHHPKLWGDPENFRPERFLTSSGTIEKPEYLIPFSCGKRQCLGESLARMEIYINLAVMLQNYDFLPPPGETVSDEGIFGIVYGPKRSRVLFRKRK